LWDEVDKLKADNKEMAEKVIPMLAEKIKNLEIEVEKAKILKTANLLYEKFEKDKAGLLPFKTLYTLLTGASKFDVNKSIDSPQFTSFLISLVKKEDETWVVDDLKVFIEIFEGCFADKTTPFAGDLDNEQLQLIVSKMREFE